jgi:hypothetical protein
MRKSSWSRALGCSVASFDVHWEFLSALTLTVARRGDTSVVVTDVLGTNPARECGRSTFQIDRSPPSNLRTARRRRARLLGQATLTKSRAPAGTHAADRRTARFLSLAVRAVGHRSRMRRRSPCGADRAPTRTPWAPGMVASHSRSVGGRWRDPAHMCICLRRTVNASCPGRRLRGRGPVGAAYRR